MVVSAVLLLLSNAKTQGMPGVKARYWFATVPSEGHWLPRLDETCVWLRGQQEVGAVNGYTHWQVVSAFSKQVTLLQAKAYFTESSHLEPTKSIAADAYVWKEETAVVGTRFEYGRKAFDRKRPADWDAIRGAAVNGDLSHVPSDVYVRCYNQLKRISQDHLVPSGVEKRVQVYWGVTGSGKSHRAWSEAGADAYPKDPLSKFWDGYRGHECVVIDEFRGGISIGHFLRWLDKYPLIVDVKGSSVVLKAKSIWITSNLHPRYWYPDLDAETFEAMMRRLEITHFTAAYQPEAGAADPGEPGDE